MKFILSIVGIIALLYLVAALALYLMQRSFIYFPTPVVSHDFAEKLVDTGNDTTVKLIVGNEAMDEAVIYFGGNAESVAGSAGSYVTALSDRAVYMVNYRGYGGSDGVPTEENLFSDAEIVFNSTSKDHTNISVIGRSLGSGVASWLAMQKPVEKLILITPYDSILNIAKASYPIFPVEFLLKDQYRSADYAASIDIPVLAILAQNDVVIPSVSSHRLIDAFTHDIEVIVLPGAGHNDLQIHPEFYPLISGFLK